MSEFAVIIDMDKTVLPTWQFVADVAQTLEAKFDIDKRLFYDQVDGRHVQSVDNLRHYDFFAHIRDLGLNADEVEAHILSAFGDRDYVYDDVSRFLDFLTTEVKPSSTILLTYGEARFQHLKYRCAPTLGSLSCVDILEPKGPYISKHFPETCGLVIDDKTIDALPASFTHVWLTRDAPQSDKTYNSLVEIEERWPEIVKASSIPP